MESTFILSSILIYDSIFTRILKCRGQILYLCHISTTVFTCFAGVSEDALKEFSMMFKHFDKEKSGKLNHQEFKSCLRALGYDLPMVEEGQADPEFDAILGI